MKEGIPIEFACHENSLKKIIEKIDDALINNVDEKNSDDYRNLINTVLGEILDGENENGSDKEIQSYKKKKSGLIDTLTEIFVAFQKIKSHAITNNHKGNLKIGIDMALHVLQKFKDQEKILPILVNVLALFWEKIRKKQNSFVDIGRLLMKYKKICNLVTAI